MPPATRLRTKAAASRILIGRASLVVLHLAALGILLWSEHGVLPALAFALTWGVLNFFWLMLLRRPVLAAGLSLVLIAILILLSQFKHNTLFMTATFTDVMILDADTFAFLMKVFPDLGWTVGLTALAAVPALIAIAWYDPLRLSRPLAAAGLVGCLAALAGLSFAFPLDREEEFEKREMVSKFGRSGAVAVFDLVTRGVFEADATANEHLPVADTCQPAGKTPHIILVLDEASFDARVMPRVTVPPGYGSYFRSFDGMARQFIVEGAGGPTWYTEYNVLSGLSVRSYGRFASAVTRFAAGRVSRGLPHALRRCGYRTFSLYPAMAAFLGAGSYQATAGIQRFFDAEQMGLFERGPDAFHYTFGEKLIAAERGKGPLFMFLYLTANHWPWTYRYRPELTPGWKDTGNGLEVDEYLRRQSMSVTDFAEFRARLARDFPDDAFLIVRFGDHQPLFAKELVDPALDEAGIARRILYSDPRYFTTYYAIDAVNFRPVELSSALDTLDAPYLPLVVLEAAGVPLDPSFAEQKKILQRCRGLFYFCADGAEARRFNRLLIDAGLIKGF